MSRSTGGVTATLFLAFAALSGAFACTRNDAAIALRARFAEDLRRGDSAAPFVDTIVARPNPLLLIVGDTVRVSYTALDARGDTWSGFVPNIHVEHRIMLDRTSAGPSVAAYPGRTRIRVIPNVSRAVTWVAVEVAPRVPHQQ